MTDPAFRRSVRQLAASAERLRETAEARRESVAYDADQRRAWGRIAATLQEWEDDAAGIDEILRRTRTRERRG